MRIEQVDRSVTLFSNAFLEDYKNGRLNDLVTVQPSIQNAQEIIKQKLDFPKEKRNTLVQVLLDQYKSNGISLNKSDAVHQNIKLLADQKTFTVTTGQQIHIGLGPLYVWYKILDAVQSALDLKEAYPEYNFVPVFWMASEDHDREEIEYVELFKQRIPWSTKQTGPVGRMSTSGVESIFDTISEKFNLDAEMANFVDAARDAYRQQNLSQAFRKLLHQYTKQWGLVILEPDDQRLKQQFSPVLVDELRGDNFEALKQSTDELISKNIKQQLVIRKCNLFYLEEGKRSRIELSDNEVLANERKLTDEHQIEAFVAANSHALSPNAALRPFYQEWTLPNIVYVGGGSEVKYWLQLKGIFDNYSMPMPLVFLRTSAIVLPEKRVGGLEIESLKEMFDSNEVLMSRYSHEFEAIQQQVAEAESEVFLSLTQYRELLNSHVQGFTFDSKFAKLNGRLEEIKKIAQTRMNTDNLGSKALDKVFKTKTTFFNPEYIQERNDHIIGFARILGQFSPNILCHFGLKNGHLINLIIT